MPGRPSHAWLNDRLVPFAEATIPIDDRGLTFAESLYEVLPITGGRPRMLAEHVARMAEAAPEIGLGGTVPSLELWERLVGELLAASPLAEGLCYAQLTGGAAPREHIPAVAPPPCFFAYLSAHRFPRDPEAKAGIAAITHPDLRWARRDLKTTMLLPAVLAKRAARDRGAVEALLVGEDGLVHEGASSNVMIVEGGAVVTPAQDSTLLPGTMRLLLTEVAREASVPLRSEPLPLDRLRAASEVFVTSSSQLAMPVVSLDGRPVGGGIGGPVARELARGLRARLELDEAG